MLGQKLHESVLELTVLQRGELVADAAEEGVHERNEQREEEHSSGKGYDHPVAKPEVNAEQQHGKSQGEEQLQRTRADLVKDEGLDGGTVKAVFLLNDHVEQIAAYDAGDQIDQQVQKNDRKQLIKPVTGED